MKKLKKWTSVSSSEGRHVTQGYCFSSTGRFKRAPTPSHLLPPSSHFFRSNKRYNNRESTYVCQQGVDIQVVCSTQTTSQDESQGIRLFLALFFQRNSPWVDLKTDHKRVFSRICMKDFSKTYGEKYWIVVSFSISVTITEVYQIKDPYGKVFLLKWIQRVWAFVK